MTAHEAISMSVDRLQSYMDEHRTLLDWAFTGGRDASIGAGSELDRVDDAGVRCLLDEAMVLVREAQSLLAARQPEAAAERMEALRWRLVVGWRQLDEGTTELEARSAPLTILAK
jgi:hypothetical protein